MNKAQILGKLIGSLAGKTVPASERFLTPRGLYTSLQGVNAKELANKLWNSNLAGTAASVGLGEMEHKLLKEHMPGAENMSPVGDSGLRLASTVFNGLFLTPFGRQLMVHGKYGTPENLANAGRALFGGGAAPRWSPKAVFGATTPKIFATMLVPAGDSLLRASGSVPNIGKSLEGAASGLKDTSEGISSMIDAGNVALQGVKETDSDTGEVKITPGLFDNLAAAGASLRDSADNTAASTERAGGILDTMSYGLAESEKWRNVAGGTLGALGGYTVGRLTGDALENKKNPDKARRLRAALQLAGLVGGAGLGYYGASKLKDW